MEKRTTTEYETPPEYETPRIEDHGDLTELTAASKPGNHIDFGLTGATGP